MVVKQREPGQQGESSTQLVMPPAQLPVEPVVPVEPPWPHSQFPSLRQVVPLQPTGSPLQSKRVSQKPWLAPGARLQKPLWQSLPAEQAWQVKPGPVGPQVPAAG
jgi:hypothetical protein